MVLVRCSHQDCCHLCNGLATHLMCTELSISLLQAPHQLAPWLASLAQGCLLTLLADLILRVLPAGLWLHYGRGSEGSVNAQWSLLTGRPR